MEMEMNAEFDATLGETIDRLTAASNLLEQTVARLEEKIASAEQKLTALEATIEASVATDPGAPSRLCLGENATPNAMGSRKTLPTQMTTLLAKQGVSVDSLEAASLEAGAIDAALASLSIEQRIAVKAQLLRAGLVS